jgi:hypothetical protein
MANGRKEALLARAKEADEMALKARDPAAKETWKKVAENYRELARIISK